MTKGSLHSENMTGGGAVPDGRYTITGIRADAKWDYGGRGPNVPAAVVTYTNDHKEDFEQGYSAGDKAVVGSEKSFDSIAKSSNFSMWLESMKAAGFPFEKLESDITPFIGCVVDIAAKAQPKRAGLKNQDGNDRTIVLIDKLISLPGAKGAKAGTKAGAAATSSAPAEAGDDPVSLTKGVIAKAGGKVEIGKLANQVYMLALRNKVASAEAKKMKETINEEWLIENMEAGGWELDGEGSVTLA